MSELRLALCSFSSGAANGIARMDDMLAGALAAHGMNVSRFLIDSCAAGEAFRQGNVMHVPLAGAYETLCDAFSHIDIVQFNGSFDPVVCAAAAAVGVPAVVEVMHNAEGKRLPGSAS